MMSTCREIRWMWLRRLQPNPVWDSLDLARLARHPLNDTSPESPPCNHHSNFSETENTFHAARHSSFLMEPGPTSNTGGHERQREQTRSTRRSMALTTSQRGDLYRLARFGSEPEREEASRLLLEDATAHLARLRSTATDSTGTPRTPVHELVVQSAEKRLRDAEELFAATKTEAEDSEATIVLPQQQQHDFKRHSVDGRAQA